MSKKGKNEWMKALNEKKKTKVQKLLLFSMCYHKNKTYVLSKCLDFFFFEQQIWFFFKRSE